MKFSRLTAALFLVALALTSWRGQAFAQFVNGVPVAQAKELYKKFTPGQKPPEARESSGKLLTPVPEQEPQRCKWAAGRTVERFQPGRPLSRSCNEHACELELVSAELTLKPSLRERTWSTVWRFTGASCRG